MCRGSSLKRLRGRPLSARLETVRKERQKAISEKQAALQALRAKNGAVADVQRAQVELQRMGQDANAEEHIGAIVEYPHPSFVLWAG